MIQEFSVRNFRSFKDEATLSFEATKDTTFKNTQVVTIAPQVRLLRFAVIYGSNASGKSNLLLVLDFLRRFWFLAGFSKQYFRRNGSYVGLYAASTDHETIGHSSFLANHNCVDKAE